MTTKTLFERPARWGAPAALAAALALSGCATQGYQTYEEPIPVSPWGGRYSFSYEPPEKKGAGSVDAAIAVVNPVYKEDESALMESAYSKVGKGFSASMGVDMDKILIAKGMTVKGPFASREEITYSDKKASALTLAPKVFVNAQLRYLRETQPTWDTPRGNKEDLRDAVAEKRRAETALGGLMRPASPQGYSSRQDKRFELKVSAWVSFVFQEPLSDEKMWIKKLELDEIVVSGQETSVNGELVYDGKPDAMADALNQMYPTIMEKFWKFIDPEEILALKEKTAEIRRLKRY